MPEKEPTKYVITCYPEYRGPSELPGGYYGPDGKPTYKERAAEFRTWEEAKKFADRHGIKVDGARVSIVAK